MSPAVNESDAGLWAAAVVVLFAAGALGVAGLIRLATRRR